MEKLPEHFLDRADLPDNVEALKDLVQDFAQKINNFYETVEYLQAQLSIMRRFQYGQRSERLKKKR